jgi:hypothetical protein
MISLKQVLLEAEADKKKEKFSKNDFPNLLSKPKVSANHPMLQPQQGVPTPKTGKKPGEHEPFTTGIGKRPPPPMAVQSQSPGINTVNTGPVQSNPNVASLDSLAQAADQGDDSLRDLPKFDNKPNMNSGGDSDDNDYDNPFGNPDFKDPPNKDKEKKMSLKDIAKGFLGKGKQKEKPPRPDDEPIPFAASGPENKLPPSWKSYEDDLGEKPTDADDEGPLNRMSQQRHGKDIFKKNLPKWKAGDKADWGTFEDVKIVKKDDQGRYFGVHNGKTYTLSPRAGIKVYKDRPMSAAEINKEIDKANED